MLTAAQNAFLTQVGPGTPTGAYFRRYWLPALLDRELSEPDGPPLRVRLLGEDLTAFKDSAGRVGIVSGACPHRGAALFFGRNEAMGLRRVYHGWKFDVEGRCVDMPNEPADSSSAGLKPSFKDKIRLTAYPCVERGGVIWVYLGPPAERPALPQMDWSLVPASYRKRSKRLQECNYLQAIEGGIDPSHLSFLHTRIGPPVDAVSTGGIRFPPYMARDRQPRYEVIETGYGLQIAARRMAAAETYYWRISQFLLPGYTIFPADPGLPLGGHAFVPIDDEHVWTWSMSWHADHPLNDEELAHMRSGLGIHAHVDPKTFRPLANRHNDYRIDRAEQREASYSGIRGIGEQDMACQEGMGPVYDRTKEHLGAADTAIIMMRRQLLRPVRALQAGEPPVSAADGMAYAVRSATLVLGRGVPWTAGAHEATRSQGARLPAECAA